MGWGEDSIGDATYRNSQPFHLLSHSQTHTFFCCCCDDDDQHVALQNENQQLLIRFVLSRAGKGEAEEKERERERETAEVNRESSGS